MKYLSNAQIQESLRALKPFNMFFGTTFLVLKKAGVVVGSMQRFSLDKMTDDFLKRYYRIHPKSMMYFRALRQGLTEKDWLAPKYASTGLQAINTQTFRDALMHEPHDNSWGWQRDYVEALSRKLPRNKRIPLFDLATWIYKDRAWDESTTREHIVHVFIEEHKLTAEELSHLFRDVVISNLSEEDAFQPEPVAWFDLLRLFSSPDDVPMESSGILSYLEFEGIGPVDHVQFEPATRFNIITGDNGLGKTFLLDLCWWALTRSWIGKPVLPLKEQIGESPSITFSIGQTHRTKPVIARFSQSDQQWEAKGTYDTNSGLVVYSRPDGSFAVWDPAPYASRRSQETSRRPVVISRDDAWDGCERLDGFVRDIVKWQMRSDYSRVFETLNQVITEISPPEMGALMFGEPTRLQAGDHREYPTIRHKYGQVPVIYESAGIKRILTLAYVLVWAWEEHKLTASMMNRPEERQMVILIDEIEAHLHPRWQRTILPGLVSAMQALHEELSVQWIISSHSPLVPASAECLWQRNKDSIFNIELDKSGRAKFSRLVFDSRGTIDSWLSSSAFGVKQPGSIERERAIGEALRIQSLEKVNREDVARADEMLKSCLTSEDPFWPRWVFFAEKYGVEE